jgi:hypothetical protein
VTSSPRERWPTSALAVFPISFAKAPTVDDRLLTCTRTAALPFADMLELDPEDFDAMGMKKIHRKK